MGLYCYILSKYEHFKNCQNMNILKIIKHTVKLLYHKLSFQTMNQINSKYNISPKPFDGGGAALVYECTRISDGEKCVQKQLKPESDKNKVKRFKREIDVMLECKKKNIQGAMPIYEYDENELWYIMPKAECLKNRLDEYKDRLDKCKKGEKAKPINGESLLKEFVECFINLARTFSQIHEKGYVHRDIKPHNLYYYNDSVYVGDFGIVDIPADSGKQLTKKGDRLGAWNTIAPEVLRDATISTGKSDVYSLAKTLWMCLTLNLEGFDGRYDYNTSSMSLHDIPHLRNTYLLDIDELLSDCTQEDYNLRPTMNDFAKRLETWKEINGDFDKRNEKEWSFMYKSIFNNNFQADQMTTSDINGIANTLNILAKYSSTNYILFPTNGGMELRGSTIAPEEECIYLDCGFTYVCRPKQLTFRGFKDDVLWNYFYLELETLKPIKRDVIQEELIEDTPGHYTDCTCAVYGVYDYESGEPLPKGWKRICRFNRGALLIISKRGFYNSITQVQDGRHSEFNEEEFYNYMNNIRDDYNSPNVSAKTVRWKYSRNPHKRFDTEPVVQTTQEKKDQVSNHLDEFDFSSILDESSDNSAVYSITIEKEGLGTDLWNPIFSNKKLFLCKDGKIQELGPDDKSIFYAHDKKIAQNIVNDIERKFEQYKNESDLENDVYVETEIRMAKIPDHIFNYKELEKVLTDGDDRIDNTLCIDENGHLVLVSPDMRRFYPVSYEPFYAYKNYVGPYINKDGNRQNYNMFILKNMMILWLEYLKTGNEARYSDGEFGGDNREVNNIKDEIKRLINDYNTGKKVAPILKS